jgi:organic radical activating enzyme
MGKTLGLGIDLTHRCNLNCSFYWKFVKQSTYEMTMAQLEDFCRYFAYLKPKKLRITGGEPLSHPQFKEMLLKLLKAFPDSLMQVTTNGTLLKSSLMMDRVQYVITPYSENEALDYPGKVTIHPRPFGYYDRDHDPNLTDRQAKKIHQTCLYKQIRVIGYNVYDCCHAETMERIKGCDPVHVRVGSGWGKEFNERSPTWWGECTHCFAAIFKKYEQ